MPTDSDLYGSTTGAYQVSVDQGNTRTSGGPRLVIRTENNVSVFSSTIAPREVTYSGYENQYNQIPRPDRKPILMRSGLGLRKISMDVFVGSEDFTASVNSQLMVLENLANSLSRIIIEYDPRTYGFWRITAMSYSSVNRNPDTDEITRATVSIEFTEMDEKTEATLNLVNVKRPKSITATGNASLSQIAMNYYGTDSTYVMSAIASANNITNPKYIPVGMKIVLP